jgi:hypothetical protein
VDGRIAETRVRVTLVIGDDEDDVGFVVGESGRKAKRR